MKSGFAKDTCPPSSRSATTTAVLLLTGMLSQIAMAQDPNDPDWLDRTASGIPVKPHMPESDRRAIDKVIVLSGQKAADQTVDGSYGKAAPGLAGGMAAGSDMGRISREIGGVPINIPIPGVQLPATIIGGLAGITMSEMQEFRDELADELANSDSPPLRTDGLAIDAFWAVSRIGGYDAQLLNPDKEWPADTDAVLLTDFGEFSIDVDGNDAIITTSIVATLNKADSGQQIYRTVIRYQDRDTLSRWTADNNALWRSYANFARYYLGRAAAADVFGRVDLNYDLVPTESADARFARKSSTRLESRELRPTLSWDLSLSGGDPYGAWSQAIDAADISYDLEIFDNRQLVYDAQALTEPSHRLTYEIEPCHTYRWSVRPVFNVDGKTRFGAWMRFPLDVGERKDAKDKSSLPVVDTFGKGLQGRQASVAPAYLQDFAELKIACSR